MINCDTSKKVTPIEVRDAIIDCFTMAHQDDTSMPLQNTEEIRAYCSELIRKFFNENRGDFNNPSKESLLKVLDQLAIFAENFRDKSVIQQNYQKMLALVNELDKPVDC